MRRADVAVVGAGAAGLMASIAAGRILNPGGSPAAERLVLLDSRSKIGAKILISGGTRCNVTHRVVALSDYRGGRPHVIRHVLEFFSPAQTIDFFNKIGVSLVLEPSGKYFPQTNSGRTVLDALKKESAHAGAVLVSGAPVTAIEPPNGTRETFHLQLGSGEALEARSVVMATGGLSLPETGSDGVGLRIAEQLGHRIIPTHPALTPMTSADAEWTALSGITLPARVSLYIEGRKFAETHESFLFTHFGFSGPAILDLSRHWSSAESSRKRVEACFLPGESDESLRARFLRERSALTIKRFLAQNFVLPESMIGAVLRKAGVPEKAAMSRLPKTHREALIRGLLHADLSVTGVVGYKKAEATCGGIDLQEVNPRTLESRRVPGLFFCGEMLDVDGRIGGFNFQWAWSSGWTAGTHAARTLK